jgi:hypothetical protein
MNANAKKKNATDQYHEICHLLTEYASITEMKDGGSAFEKRKIKSAAFSADKAQLVITGGEPDLLPYTIVLRSQRKIYLRTDREYDKIIIRGDIGVGEDFSGDDRKNLVIYLKGFAPNSHASIKLKKNLMALIEAAKK